MPPPDGIFIARGASPATHFAVRIVCVQMTREASTAERRACPGEGQASVLGGSLRLRGSGELAQHILQDAAALEVIELVERIDAADERHALERSVAHHDLGNQALARLQLAV